ncbi:uncharacterized protein LOC143363341 isoform X1 [Halictus rubicundus]|uniref:uncharacterized protein LOC143363341 isoform X1 n=1 Tax=Halictus rubicundus TaxID=77578 RepID=UPI004036BB02
MDENTGTNPNYEELENMQNEELKKNDGASIKSRSKSQQNLKARSHSRSRSPINTKSSRRWVSSNAFVNFVQDFRQNHIGMRSTKLFQLAGEKWKRMLPNEKQPYVDAAKNIKNQKQDQLKKENVNVANPTNIEPKKDEKSRQTKSTKKSKNNKEKKQKQKKKNKYNTESDTDSAVSATSATSFTSEDLSDMSS